MTNIIIVVSYTLFREGLKLLIENENLGEVVAEAVNGQDFLKLLEKHNPDLVMMDIEMPVMGGVETMQKALQLQPNIKVLGLAMAGENSKLQDMVRAGAMGVVLKTAGKNEFENAIKSILQGENYYSSVC
jgi:DNA-binding NarL/FixJ family response regulator